MRRSIAVVCLGLVVVATPAAAQEQSLNLFVGGFTPRGLDGRGTHDVLFQNLDFLTFDIKDFNGPTVGAEWLFGLGHNIEAGVGTGFYQRTSPAIHTRLTHKNGDEIEQDLKLRVVPFTATLRVLPLGRNGAIRPYFGAGVAVLSWRYSETGEFVDFDHNNEIFRDNFISKGSNAAPLVLGGATFPLGNVGLGGEIRWQGGRGNLSSDWPAGTKIDLGGMTYLFMVNLRF